MTELTIKMTVYNKLKIAILSILASQQMYAMNVDPIQIQSTTGELLYAEINFRQSNVNEAIDVSLATAEDLMSIGASHRPPGHLNFFTRRNSNGTGVITITSSRPLTESELNIVVKIKEGNATRLQHIRTPLKRSAPAPLAAMQRSNEQALMPVMIVNEQDIALNLPVSANYQVETPKAIEQQTFEAPLTIKRNTPPALNHQTVTVVQTAPSRSAASENTTVITPKVAPAQTNNNPTPTASTATTSVTAQQSADPLVQKFAEQQRTKQLAQTQPAAATKKPAQIAATQAKPSPVTAKPTVNTQHVVQSNESLWAIASRIAGENNRPVAEVMQQIKANNEHAFIQGDANRLRRGATLNLHAQANSKPEKKAAIPKPETASTPQSGKAKYRLNQAEMSLVAENQQDSTHGSAKKNTQSTQTSGDLSLKVMTSREKTVKLQRNVTELELALRQKDHRIQLLNARLAELQQQLQKQQAANKPKH
ncbi:FimV family protein [Acinetobacter towneri]|uniref:type IV pilus assembly protein FimV n=1 Tax=Acinetobacter towneri TaxID=202956 RepID=UPI003A8BD6BE